MMHEEPHAKPSYQTKSNLPNPFFAELQVPGAAATVANNFSSSGSNLTDSLDNGDVPIVLGSQITNPYTVRKVQNAYNMLYGDIQTLTANYLYVKFKPANADQLEILEDNENLELQDYPMDFEVIQEGDFYQDPLPLDPKTFHGFTLLCLQAMFHRRGYNIK
jgi:hypothetical protein